MTRHALGLLVQSFSRRNMLPFLSLALIWAIIQIPLGQFLLSAYTPMGWLKQTLFGLLWPGLLMPFFTAATYRMVLAARWRPGSGPLALIRRVDFWPTFLKLILATFAGRLAAIQWAVMTGGLGWHQFPPTAPEQAGDLLARVAEAISAQSAAAAGAVVTCSLLIGLPGRLIGQARPDATPLLSWRRSLPLAVILIFPLETLLAAEHVLYNTAQQLIGQPFQATGIAALSQATRALSWAQTYLIEFLHAYLLFGATAAIHGALWPSDSPSAEK